jgi:cytochrome P450
VEFNPFAYDFHEDPHPTYAWLRDHAPVYHNPTIGFWALSRFADVLDALHDYQTFTSTGGVAIEDTGTAAGDDADAPIRSLIDLDPPAHTALRRIIARRFTPRQIAQLEPLVVHTSRRLLDGLEGRREFDVVVDFAALLPTTVIATLLGFPVAVHEDLRVWTETILHREPGSPEIPRAGIDAIAKMMELSARTVYERRDSPRDDLLSALVHADVDGRPPTDAEMLGFCLVLITGGHETTSKLIANGVRSFRRHPSQRSIATRSPETMRRAVEELLRYWSPTQYMARTTTRDVAAHGETIPAGSKVALLLGCGNRDHREFDQPDDFDVTRLNARILAFGHGAHACLGAAVARLEARVALTEFLDRYDRYDVDEDRIELLHSGNVAGPSKVPISVS